MLKTWAFRNSSCYGEWSEKRKRNNSYDSFAKVHS